MGLVCVRLRMFAEGLEGTPVGLRGLVELVVQLLGLPQAAQGQLGEKDVPGDMAHAFQFGIGPAGGGPIPLEEMREGHGPHGRASGREGRRGAGTRAPGETGP